MNSEIYKKLTEIAFKKSKPFCYHCYEVAPTGTCSKCHSDDLMRLVDGVGCEYSTEWVVKHILETALEPVDLEEAFEQSVRECYPETTIVGWCEFDTVTILKEQDPVSWQCALADYESAVSEEGNVISFDNGSNYYWAHDVDQFIEGES
ncbi:MAG: hypothetical protein IPM97_01730 [Bdellovibrionaceae bacterium]|nr:hypothetical protein [Pseudobdellovibrionaceae bacterium]